MPKGRPKFQGEPWRDTDDIILRREWKKGTLAKVIVNMLRSDRTARSVASRARRLGLGIRRIKRDGRLSLEISKKEKALIQKRAQALGLTVAAYVRLLIRRDNGN